jgi:hypothetical protein
MLIPKTKQSTMRSPLGSHITANEKIGIPNYTNITPRQPVTGCGRKLFSGK